MPCISLKTTSPMEPLDDLAPFVKLTASRLVIGLGEATHGTREAFRLKHRLIRALAEQGGLRTLAFECGMAAGRLIDGYVRFGRSTAREALLRQGYWCWENREVLELIEWLRQHNFGLPQGERIAFVGIDVQKVESGLTELLSALEECSASQHAGHAQARKLADHAVQAVRRLLCGELTQGSPDAARTVGLLTEAAPRLMTPELRALCRNAARYVDTYLNPEHEEGLALRDEYLATTVLETLAERPGPMVVWAHNEHVAINPDFFGARAMGHQLREALGNAYIALGMLFGEGSFLARSWGERSANAVAEFRIGEAGHQHVERCFSDKAFGLYCSASLPGSTRARYRRFLGALYDPGVDAANPDAFRIERPLTDFDVVAWLPETSAARYLAENALPIDAPG